MITKEMKEKGICCKGRGFNCIDCKDKFECVDYEEINRFTKEDKEEIKKLHKEMKK